MYINIIHIKNFTENIDNFSLEVYNIEILW